MSNKTCDNCYLTLPNDRNHCIASKVRPLENTCNRFMRGCEHCKEGLSYIGIANFHYNDDIYCEECLCEKLEIEKRPYKAYQYYDMYGNFLGDTENDDLCDILLGFDGVSL